MTNLTQDQQLLSNFNEKTAQLLYYTCTYVIPVGIALNILSSIVFMRKKFSKTTMGFYNIAISIINIFFAIFTILSYIGKTYDKDLTLMSDFSCIFLAFALRVFAQMSSWMNVFVTVDRMISIAYPNKYSLLKCKKRLSLLIFIQFILLCLINAPNFLFKVQTFSSTDPLTNDTITTKSCKSTETIAKVRDMIMATFKVALPIIIMAVLNIFLIYKLIKEKSKFKRLDELKKEYYFAFSIVFMNILYTILLLPAFSTLVYLTAFQYIQHPSIMQTRNLIIWQFAYAVSLVIVSYEFFFSIFVNILFNKMFKKELFAFLLKRLFCLGTNSNSSQSNNIANGNNIMSTSFFKR